MSTSSLAPRDSQPSLELAPAALDEAPRGPCQTCCSGEAFNHLQAVAGESQALETEALETGAPRQTPAETEAIPSSPPVPQPAALVPAFSAFLHASRRRPPSTRAVLCWSLAGVLHVVVLGWGLAQAFWHVDEIASAPVKVSLLLWSDMRLVAPPPPPPPPKASASKSEHKVETRPRPDLVQPTQVAQAEPEPQTAAEPEPSAPEGAQAGGVEGGVSGGVLGGVLTNTVAIPAAPTPPALTASERERLVTRYITDSLDRRIKAHLFYPPEAEEDELEGVIWLSVVINDRGQLVSARVVKGGELGALSRAALQTVHRAQPFPPPPAVLGSSVEVRVPLTYRLEG